MGKDNRGFKFNIGSVLGDMTIDEAARARELFKQGEGFREVYAALAADRPQQQQRRRFSDPAA